MTVNGRIELRRVRWHEAETGSQTPIDPLLDETEQAFSEGVREMLCRLDRGSHNFKHVVDSLYRTAHLHVSKETARRLIEREGRRVLQQQHQAALPPAWQAGDCRTTDGTTRVYLGLDGVMVPLVTDAEKCKRRARVKQKRQRSGRRCRPLPPRQQGADQAYKEFKLVGFYDECRPQTRRYVSGTSGDHEAAGRLMRRMATQLDFPQADEKIANVDGAPWIRNQIELHGVVDALGLDYYHLREQAEKARHAIYGEAAEGKQWKDQLMGLLLEQGYDAAWDSLVAWRRTLRGTRRRAADALIGYLVERREMIRYPEFRRRGWQIGSGPTEAQCKVATSRLKGRGRRWDKRNAEAIMALDCLDSSRQWNQYWTNLAPSSN